MYFSSILLYNNPITETILCVNKMKNFFIKATRNLHSNNLINGIDKFFVKYFLYISYTYNCGNIITIKH